jgi:hypothetical protein
MVPSQPNTLAVAGRAVDTCSVADHKTTVLQLS